MAQSRVREWHFKEVDSVGRELVGGSIIDVRRKRFFIEDIDSPLVKADLIAAFENGKLPEVEYARKVFGQHKAIIKIKKVMKK